MAWFIPVELNFFFFCGLFGKRQIFVLKPAVKVSEAVFTVNCAIFHLFRDD